MEISPLLCPWKHASLEGRILVHFATLPVFQVLPSISSVREVDDDIGHASTPQLYQSIPSRGRFGGYLAAVQTHFHRLNLGKERYRALESAQS